jgi:lipopolysaccharide biosynthesis glycosyltransferase
MREEIGRITVVTVCDNHFAVMLAALIKSIELNHLSGETIDLYIVEDGMSGANRKLIKSTVENPKIFIHWLAMDQVVDKKKLPMDASTFPLNVYSRLFIPHFLPESCSKAIYLDVDMIVRKDLSLLWHVDLQGRIIAGVLDRAERVSTSWAGIANYKELGIPAESGYYNSGLLVLDLEQWRRLDLTEEIVSCIIQNKQYASFPDQYGLNVVFANKWYTLDPAWNTYAFQEAKDPFVIHFIGVKPIYSSYNNNQEYKNEFFAYLSRTGFKNYRIKSGYVRFLKKLYNLAEKKIKTLVKVNRT